MSERIEPMKIKNHKGGEVEVLKNAGDGKLTEARIQSLEEDILTIANILNGWESVFSVLVANSNKIYHQIDTSYGDNAIHIRAPRNILTSTALIYVLPCESIDTIGKDDVPTLVMHTGAGDPITLYIKKEDFHGNLIAVSTGDIISNRVCMFRLNPYNPKEIILCNSLSAESLSVDELVCNRAIFNNLPVVKTASGEEQVQTAKKQLELIDELDERYQKKIVFGMDSPEEYTKNNYLAPGQIYIQTAYDVNSTGQPE